MVFKEYKNEKEFFEENGALLFLVEDINNTMLNVIFQVNKEKLLFRIEDDGDAKLIGLITKTERKGLVVYIKDYEISLDVYEFLIEQIVSRNIELREIKGPKGIANILFDLYSKKVNVEMKKTKTCYLMKLNNYSYDTVVNNNGYILRKADINDLEFEKNIALNISEETLKIQIDEIRAYEIAKVFIERGLYFLTDESGMILTQAATTKLTENGCTIGAVYTPIELRRKGYCKICLNELIKLMKQNNKEIIVLYSNVLKPENKKLYESLGFEIILEETVIKF